MYINPEPASPVASEGSLLFSPGFVQVSRTAVELRIEGLGDIEPIGGMVQSRGDDNFIGFDISDSGESGPSDGMSQVGGGRR
jgi:hypothetical protein